MSVLRSTYMTNVRNQMDAVGSGHWSDAEVTTALGVISGEEWSGILGANPYYRFAQRAVTCDANGKFAYTSLNSGSGDTAQNWYRIIAITDGNMSVYRQTTFQAVPLATVTNLSNLWADRVWYDAGDNAQVLPVQPSLALTVSVNYTPPTIDQLSGDNVAVDFPLGHEAVIYLGAAAFLLDKRGEFSDAANVLRASQAARRNQMYQDLGRRSAQPMMLSYPDYASDWGGFF